MQDAELWGYFALILALILANGFFAGSEIAIVSVRRGRIEQLIAQGSKAAEVVKRLKDESDRFLATVQIGVTVVGSLASVVGGVMAAEYLSPAFRAKGAAFLDRWAESLAIGIVVVGISYLSLVLGELVPKSLALRYAERVACVVARPIDFFSRLSGVVVKVMTLSSNFVLFLLRSGGKAQEAFISEEEVKFMVREGAQKGIFDETERELIHSVFEFADMSVREVMTPRNKIHAVDLNTSCETTLKEMNETGFSRFPVYEDDLDHIVGIVYIKDVLRAQEKGAAQTLRDIVHPPYFVPDSVQISHLLKALQSRRTHMAVVVNEYGTIIGIATIEDLLEEIVGEIRDESDVEEEQAIQIMSDGSLLVEGGVPLDDLRERHRLPVAETPEFRTIAGFILARLGKIPHGGEAVFHEGYKMTIVAMDSRRVAGVKIERVKGAGRLKAEEAAKKALAR